MAKLDTAGKVKKYFTSNQSRKEIHATTDGFLFERKQDANNHSKTLDDKKVETFTKSEKVAAALSEAAKDAKKGEADKKAATNSAGAKKNTANTGSDQQTAK